MKLRVLIVSAASLLLLYLGDSIALRLRHDQLGSVTVERYDAIPEKNGKTEFQFEQPIAQNCVRSLFPHRGYPACWYLKRHNEQRIDY